MLLKKLLNNQINKAMVKKYAKTSSFANEKETYFVLLRQGHYLDLVYPDTPWDERNPEKKIIKPCYPNLTFDHSSVKSLIL